MKLIGLFFVVALAALSCEAAILAQEVPTPAKSAGTPQVLPRPIPTSRATSVALAGEDPLPKGKSQITVKFDYDGGGAGKGATVTLLVNGAKVANGRLEMTVPAQFSLGEGFDVGMDHGSAVDFTYKPPFAFNGTIQEVRIELK